MSFAKNIVCFGEVLWDIYPQDKKLGGAPFNVAAHLKKLGSKAYMISKVGADTYGKEIMQAVKSQGIPLNQLQVDDNFETGQVLVTLNEFGIPTYEIKEPVAWDFIHSNLDNLDLVRNSDALIYGTLACRSSRNLDTLMDLMKMSSLNICDLNIRQNYYSKKIIEALLPHTDILKINDKEKRLLCRMFELEESVFYDKINARFDFKIIITTKGGDGAEAYSDSNLVMAMSPKVKVLDTVGSGDAFLAAFTHNYLQGHNIKICLEAGTRLGAYVATRSGAIPEHALNKKTA